MQTLGISIFKPLFAQKSSYPAPTQAHKLAANVGTLHSTCLSNIHLCWEGGYFGKHFLELFLHLDNVHIQLKYINGIHNHWHIRVCFLLSITIQSLPNHVLSRIHNCLVIYPDCWQFHSQSKSWSLKNIVLCFNPCVYSFHSTLQYNAIQFFKLAVHDVDEPAIFSIHGGLGPSFSVQYGLDGDRFRAPGGYAAVCPAMRQ
jgi:hypothetical protein